MQRLLTVMAAGRAAAVCHIAVIHASKSACDGRPLSPLSGPAAATLQPSNSSWPQACVEGQTWVCRRPHLLEG